MIKKIILHINIDMEKIKEQLPTIVYEEIKNKSDEEWNKVIEEVVSCAVESEMDEFTTLKSIEVE